MFKKTVTPCNCSVYSFPHRPGSGKCEYIIARNLMLEMYGYDLSLEEYADNDAGDAAATVREIACLNELAPTPRYWQIQYADMF